MKKTLLIRYDLRADVKNAVNTVRHPAIYHTLYVDIIIHDSGQILIGTPKEIRYHFRARLSLDFLFSYP